jgi:hypothetical protein
MESIGKSWEYHPKPQKHGRITGNSRFIKQVANWNFQFSYGIEARLVAKNLVIRCDKYIDIIYIYI